MSVCATTRMRFETEAALALEEPPSTEDALPPMAGSAGSPRRTRSWVCPRLEPSTCRSGERGKSATLSPFAHQAAALSDSVLWL